MNFDLSRTFDIFFCQCRTQKLIGRPRQQLKVNVGANMKHNKDTPLLSVLYL